MNTTLPESLQRRPDESSEAHTALTNYAQLGPSRSLDKLAEQYRNGTNTCPPTRRRTTLAEWSSRYDWQERIGVYDEGLAAQALAETEATWRARREQQREESWRLAQELQKRAIELLAWPIEEQITLAEDGKQITIVKPARWSQRDIVAIAEAFQKLGALATGSDTAQIRIEGLNPHDLANLSDEELAALEARLLTRRR